MIISRIMLDPSKHHTRRAISVPQVLHAAVEGCFPDKIEKERKLWRIDRLQDSLYLLLLSPGKPDFTEFAHQLCYRGVEGETKDYTPLLASIQTGVRLQFRLRANPTHSVSTEKGARGKVYPHISVKHKREWLKKKAEKCGFKLEEHLFDVVESDHLRFLRSNTTRPVEIGVAVYEGELEVTDREMFVQTLTQGVGRAKAYGCGLLTVAGFR